MRRRSILIIDNDREIVDLLSFYFEEHGFVVETAVDGHTGVALAQLRKPDVVICDIIMDRMHGFEVIQKLRALPTATLAARQMAHRVPALVSIRLMKKGASSQA